MTPRIGMFPPAGLLERDQDAAGAFLAEARAAGVLIARARPTRPRPSPPPAP
jgi:hypothetical protein